MEVGSEHLRTPPFPIPSHGQNLRPVFDGHFEWVPEPHLAPRGLWAPPWHALKAMAGWERCLDVVGMGEKTSEGLNFGIELTNDKPLDSRVPMVLV